MKTDDKKPEAEPAEQRQAMKDQATMAEALTHFQAARDDLDKLEKLASGVALKVGELEKRPDHRAAIADIVAILATLAAQVPGAHQIEARIARLRATLG